jgi:hypothetical protein
VIHRLLAEDLSLFFGASLPGCSQRVSGERDAPFDGQHDGYSGVCGTIVLVHAHLFVGAAPSQ